MREFELVGGPISEQDQTESSTEQMGQTYAYQVIPEFPSWASLVVMVVAVMAVAVIYRSILSKPNGGRRG